MGKPTRRRGPNTTRRVTRRRRGTGPPATGRGGRPAPARVVPGEYLLGEGDVVANANRQTVELTVANTGDRPIQVGSHFHFYEANRALRFDRLRAFGMRLNIPAGTAVRFEPGDAKHVTLVELGGARRAWGLNGLSNGAATPDVERLRAWEAEG
jgi:urease subunit beta